MLKLTGPHIIRCTPEAMAWSKVAPILKCLDTVEPFLVARPEALRIFRHFFKDQDWSRSAEDIAGELVDALHGYRHPMLVVEVAFNEVRYVSWEKMWKLSDIIHAQGIRTSGPCWSTGDFDGGEWLEGRQNLWGGLNFINLHTYFSKNGFTIWNALRWTQYWNGSFDPKVIISEAGIDAVEGGTPGWKLSGISGEEYVALLAAYDAELQQHPEVIGATVFTAGPYPDSQWVPYDVDGIIPLILASTSEIPDNSSNNSNSSEGGNMSTNHSLWDWFMKGLGGSGYNPATALGKLREQHPELGMMVGGEETFSGTAGTFICQRFTGGIAWAEVDNWEHSGVARTEAELPFA